MLTYLLQGAALGLAAAAQPGPFLAYLISLTLSRGFRNSWTGALAPLVSDGPIIALSLLVLAQMPLWLQRSLNLAGGLFILYLAWGAFRQWRVFASPGELPADGPKRGIIKAALMNALSPMPYIYWSLVTGPILLKAWQQSPLSTASFLGGFYAAMIFCLLGIMLLFNSARQLGDTVSRTLLGLSALALTVLGCMQLWSATAG